MNKELVLILKEIKRVSETSKHGCTGSKFKELFRCLNVSCGVCILNNIQNPKKYNYQIFSIPINL
ncbi:hypothetical protein CPT_Pollock18 [Escherichia phage Pollock]|uniref:Uncharacterized protein n=1 Tax=Escherichia phage Pollock TaxID=1540097 RepID=A0A0A0YRI0_9CAUD|nr:hypothetical protein ACQ44_gp18 [Escherichia phage Pollock]AIX12377.1 hypothetical protein CPT_Pollock18 [Escherichia phage Pollock]